MLALVTTLLLALLAACGSDDDSSSAQDNPDQSSSTSAVAPAAPDASTPESSEASTEDEEDPTPTAPQVEATATPAQREAATVVDDDDADETATKEAQDDEDRLVGRASVDDDEDDVVNLLMQEPDDPMPGIDLANVVLEGDGNEIVVTIQTFGDIQAELTDDVDVSFDVHLWQDGKPAYAMSFHYDDSDEWEATVTDFTVAFGDEETVDTDITIVGNTISAAFPGSLFPEIEPSFEWYASVMLSEGEMAIGLDSWFDGAPENVLVLLADPDEFVEFPQ